MMARPSRFWQLVFRLPVYLYRWRLGWLLGRRFLLLIHVGRRSGRQHETVLEIMEYRPPGPEVVVMSGWGANAQWLRNIEAHPGPEVVIGCDRFVASHRVLGADAAIAVLAGYERHNRYAAWIIRTVLSLLLGWPYRSCDSDRRRLASQLPLIAFSPRA
jgi:deazaflavin-dependent oxidoreductase (nitroreductase family)